LRVWCPPTATRGTHQLADRDGNKSGIVTEPNRHNVRFDAKVSVEVESCPINLKHFRKFGEEFVCIIAIDAEIVQQSTRQSDRAAIQTRTRRDNQMTRCSKSDSSISIELVIFL
jgi:hypothetical protein